MKRRDDRARALGEIACDVLQRLARELISRKPGGHLIEAGLDQLDLRLRLGLRGSQADPAVFSQQLVAAVDGLLDDLIQHAAIFRPGHAFCHRCGTASCEHSEPPTCRHVFVGYGPTGTPRWEDFAQVCLDTRHPRVDELFSEPPAFVTLIGQPTELRGHLLDAFQAREYDLLGQVCAGFFQTRPRLGEGRGVLALTFQVAASRPSSGRLRIGLNILGKALDGESLDLMWERHEEIPWRAAVRWAQSALVSVAQARGERAPIERRVEGIVRGLARRLERDQRSRGRRTQHAEDRHLSGDRPTRKALDDAREARSDSVLVDEKNGTLVVAGERGRVHFFTAEGRHVSSVRYSRDAIERKRKLGLWRDAKPGEAEPLLEKLRVSVTATEIP